MKSLEINFEKIITNINNYNFSFNYSNYQKYYKKIEDKIFAYKESVRLLKSDLENIQLEYDYLSSAEKLLEYQSLYFEDQLVQKKIEDIKIYNISENVNKLEDYKITEEK